jgi:radical SAM-linked protein
MQRLRIRFSRSEELKFISHLDIIRLWERAFRRAHIALAYSEGFSPHPRISLAAPLSVGITSDVELMDVVLAGQVSPHWFTASVNRQLPQGMSVLEAYLIAPTVPSLQSQVRFARYEIDVETDRDTGEIEAAISDLLTLEHLPWYHMRDTGRRDYDLRALINDIRLAAHNGSYCTIEMMLRCDNSGSGRPEQVAIALGFAEQPTSIRRTELVLDARRRPYIRG